MYIKLLSNAMMEYMLTIEKKLKVIEAKKTYMEEYRCTTIAVISAAWQKTIIAKMRQGDKNVK